MQPKESLEKRTEMAHMHDDVLKRINKAITGKSYIEACWLCYACFESRVSRIMEKIFGECDKPDRTTDRHIGISTKIECLTRLAREGYLNMDKKDVDTLNSIKSWCKRRNILIHGLVTIEKYDASEKEFKELARGGKTLVTRAYEIAKNIREQYYEAERFPAFSEQVCNRCRLQRKCQ